MEWQALLSGALSVLAPGVTDDEDPSARRERDVTRRIRAKYEALGPPPDRASPETHEEDRAAEELAVLERKVEDLRAFEREYRTRLTSFLEWQLRQLEQVQREPDGPEAPPTPPADLRAFEREYLVRMKAFLESQLRQLKPEHDGLSAPPQASDGTAAGPPRRASRRGGLRPLTSVEKAALKASLVRDTGSLMRSVQPDARGDSSADPTQGSSVSRPGNDGEER